MCLYYLHVSICSSTCSYPGVFTDVPTGHFLPLYPQFTGLGSEGAKDIMCIHVVTENIYGLQFFQELSSV